MQREHAVLRNYPVIGHVRWLVEMVRPEIRQYLLESEDEATPFSRSQRSLVYRRAKAFRRTTRSARSSMAMSATKNSFSTRRAPRPARSADVPHLQRLRYEPGGHIRRGHIAAVLAIGADWTNVARGYMFALGCIQSMNCHTNRCPTGVATQDKSRQRALAVPDKAERVLHFHDRTVGALADMLAAAGLSHPDELRPHHVAHRVSSTELRQFDQVHHFLADGELLSGACQFRTTRGTGTRRRRAPGRRDARLADPLFRRPSGRATG